MPRALIPGNQVIAPAQPPAPPADPTLDFFALIGQSNALGRGDAPEAPAVPSGQGLEYVYPATFQPLVEPTGAWRANSEVPSGSLAAAWAVRWFELTGRQALIYNGAWGGSAQIREAATGIGGHWDVENVTGVQRYVGALVDIDRAFVELAARSMPYVFRGVIWDQGGRDGQVIDLGTAGVTKAIYKAKFQAMIAALRAKYGATLKVFVVRLGRPNAGDTAGWLDVRTAQDEVVAADANTDFVHTDAINFPTRGLMKDSFHYKQAGYNEIGELGAEVAEAVF